MNRLGIALRKFRHSRACWQIVGIFTSLHVTHIASSEVFTTEQTVEQEKNIEGGAPVGSRDSDPGIVNGQ